eukprot:2320588-Alexandrium_andersonii.AAC.1
MQRDAAICEMVLLRRLASSKFADQTLMSSGESGSCADRPRSKPVSAGTPCATNSTPTKPS